MNDRRRGLKLSEMILIIFVVGALMGIFVVPIQRARESGRRAQCQNNMRQLGLGLLGFSSARNHYPNAGTFFDDPADHGGNPAKSNIYRAITNPASFTAKTNLCLYNWVTDLTPYFDHAGLPDMIDRHESYLCTKPNAPGYPSNLQVTSMTLRILCCPDDPTIQLGQGNLSYVVNGGFARWYPIPVGWVGSAKDGQSWNGDVLHWADGDQRVSIGRKLGVMFLGTHTGDQPWDIKTTPSDITDGHSSTLLLGENILAGYSKGTPYSGGLPTNWACPLPNFSMFLGSDDVCRSASSETDCLAGQLKRLPDGKAGPGWSWANHPGSVERINYGANLTVEGSSPFANSAHPGGSNFVFCDGSVRYLSSSLDGKVYARIITPAGGALPPSIRQASALQNGQEP